MTKKIEELSTFLAEELRVLTTIINENKDRIGKVETKIKEFETIEKKELQEAHKKIMREITALKTFTNFTVVVSSRGEAAKLHGDLLGQYEFDPEKNCYVQTNTELHTNTEPTNFNFNVRYLYQYEDDKWWVGSKPGRRIGWLHNPIPSKTLPISGWRYGDGWGSFHDDPTLTVTPGPLLLPRQFTVTAPGAPAEVSPPPSCLGVFTRTERWWYGRPIYVNNRGRLLHHDYGNSGWMIGERLGWRALLMATQSYHSPDGGDSWIYWTGSEWKPVSVTVTGSE